MPQGNSISPNILVIVADDMGWGDLSVHGNRGVQTPHIDSLARDGQELKRFFVSPVCAPTRAEFLTGRRHQRSGCLATMAGRDRIDLEESTLAEDLRAAGYATGVFGKWHNGAQGAYHPMARGFDEFTGFTCGHLATNYEAPLERNGERIQSTGYVPDFCTEEAMSFMEERAKSSAPFFCFVPLNTPHEPLQVDESFFETVAPADQLMSATHPEKESPAHTRAALAMCANLDWNVGRMLDKLEQLGVAEETIVVYFSDHGPNGWRWNGGFEGVKASVNEGGVRSPCFIRWSAKLEGGKAVDPIGSSIDLRPTLMDLADLGSPRENAGRKLDGISLAPLLRGEADAATWPDREIIAHFNGKVSVRTQRFRLCPNDGLYEIEVDPGQTRDLTAQFPEEAARLRQIRDAWQEQYPFEPDEPDPRPFSVGHPTVPSDVLTAEHGVPHGNIRRNNRWASSTWFENWVSLDDRIEWDVEVMSPGRYKVELLYACPEGQTGSVVELERGGRRLKATLSVPHNTPLRGAAEDLWPRKVSYQKDFRAWELGEMELAEGRKAFSVRALEIPGEMVMELGALVLCRQNSDGGASQRVSDRNPRLS